VTHRYVLATANPDKAAEVRQILADSLGDVELLERPGDVPEVVEDGDSLEANARLKALALVDATGRPAIADDTGLEVDVLGGAPGVYSARYAGEEATYSDNVAKLLGALVGVPPAERTARFRTVVLARYPDGSEVMGIGEVSGRIGTEPRGGNGFGYDPVFLPEGGGGRSFAEMSPSEKHAISHRGRAVRALAEQLAGAPEPTVRGRRPSSRAGERRD
jgi:XTP/dITP diphosphohydrolase